MNYKHIMKRLLYWTVNFLFLSTLPINMKAEPSILQTAQDLSATRIDWIRKATTLADLKKRKVIYSRLQEKKAACVKELQLNRVPGNCYELLAEEHFFNFISSEKSHQLMLILDRHCLEIQSEKIDWQVWSERRKNSLSSNCRQHVETSLHRSLYVLQEKNSDQLFLKTRQDPEKSLPPPVLKLKSNSNHKKRLKRPASETGMPLQQAKS